MSELINLCAIVIVLFPVYMLIQVTYFDRMERLRAAQSKRRIRKASYEFHKERDKRQQETAWRTEKQVLIIEWQAEKARQRRIESGRRAIDRAIEMELAA